MSESSDIIDKIPKDILEKIKSNNQTHLLECLKNCTTKESQEDFISQLKSIDYDLMSHLYKLGKERNIETAFKEEDITKIESQYPRESIKSEIDSLSKVGMEYIAEGKIGMLILAGGMGTRLGFDHPKGIYNIKMPSNKTLFNYFANRFLSCQLMCKKTLEKEGNKKNLVYKDCPLLIMTNLKNYKEISEYFKENNYFGIKKENIYFFPQGEICVLDDFGRIILDNPSKIFKSPDGNGGCLLALKNEKIIDECLSRGVEYINVTSVDNPLYKLMDPLFVGLTVTKGKNGKDQMGAKYIKKVDPEQKIGYFLNYKSKPMMIDYMEMPNTLKQKKIENGDFYYNAGNILDYLISVNFLKKALFEENNIKTLLSSFHHVRKKMNCYVYDDELKKVVEKKNFEHSKYEMFFNSIFEFSNKEGLLLLEIDPKDEFSPVKNDEKQSQSCTAATCREQMSNLFKKWVIENGGEIKNDDPKKYLELSFLVSYDGRNLFDSGKVPKELDMKDVKPGEGIYIKNNELE